MAIKERSFAAITMVETAKAKGWTSVNFADTSDPVERYILSLACNKLGLHHTETITIPEGYEDIFQNISGMFDNVEQLRMTSIMIDGDENFSASPAPTNNTATTDTSARPATSAAGGDPLAAYMAELAAREARFGSASPS